MTKDFDFILENKIIEGTTLEPLVIDYFENNLPVSVAAVENIEFVFSREQGVIESSLYMSKQNNTVTLPGTPTNRFQSTQKLANAKPGKYLITIYIKFSSIKAEALRGYMEIIPRSKNT
jgi:hypothetical protein